MLPAPNVLILADQCNYAKWRQVDNGDLPCYYCYLALSLCQLALCSLWPDQCYRTLQSCDKSITKRFARSNWLSRFDTLPTQ